MKLLTPEGLSAKTQNSFLHDLRVPCKKLLDE